MSSVTPAFVVLDTLGLMTTLSGASEYYAQPQQLTLSSPYMEELAHGATRVSDRDEEVTVAPIPKLTKPRAMMLLAALYKEALSQNTYYRTHESPVQAVAMALRDCAIPDRVDLAMAEEFLTMEKVDGVVIDINMQLTKLLGGCTWQQWDLIETPNLLALLGGQDYRIAEWKRFHGHDHRTEDTTLSVDISAVANYIRQTLVKHKGEQIAAQIPIGPIIADAVQRRYPLVEFKKLKALPYEQVQTLLGVNYEDFYNQFIKQVIDAFRSYFLIANIDGSVPYRGEVTNAYNLVFYATQPPRNDEERYFHDLKKSVELGDWVPESERRRLQEFERTHTL